MTFDRETYGFSLSKRKPPGEAVREESMFVCTNPRRIAHPCAGGLREQMCEADERLLGQIYLFRTLLRCELKSATKMILVARRSQPD